MTPDTEDGMVLLLWRGLIPVKSIPLTKREIISFVAAKYDLTPDDLTMPNETPGSHLKFRREPRQEAMWMMRQVTRPDGSPRYSLPDIGMTINRDHTSVLAGIRRHQARLDASRLEVAA